jgi:NAD(P)-dependent dehydrogenase (short-subunit alcohol dehydrogenase family)
MHRLQGKITLVTGAARGIGEAVARHVVEEGARVLVTDIADAAGEAVAASLGEMATYAHLDVRVETDWERVTADVLERFGRLDGLVNNAGITGFEEGVVPHDPEHAALEDWRAVHATNLDGVFLGCKHAIGAMRRTGEGAIVNVASRSGLVGVPAAAAYASSKAAIRNHTKSVALYCAAQGLRVRCNAVLPAAILTPMWEPMLGGPEEREARMRALVRDVPLARWGTPGEVAAVVVHLLADESAYTTGAELVLDGGITAGAVAAPQR